MYFVDADEIIQISKTLQKKSSSGCDDIPSNIMAMSIVPIAKPLAVVINSSFRNGIFPDPLKVEKVCPIYKTGEKNLFGNYRPISILPSF